MKPNENIARCFAADHRHKLSWEKPTHGPLKDRTDRWFIRTKGYWHEDMKTAALSLMQSYLRKIVPENPELFSDDESEARAIAVLKLARRFLKPVD